jgi:hypothetical protein
MWSLYSLCVCVPTDPPTLIDFGMPGPIFMKFGMYIMAPESISVTYFINPSRQTVCLYVYPTSLLGNGSVKPLPWQNTHTTLEELLYASFPMRSVSYQRKVGDYCFLDFFVSVTLIIYAREERIMYSDVYTTCISNHWTEKHQWEACHCIFVENTSISRCMWLVTLVLVCKFCTLGRGLNTATSSMFIHRSLPPPRYKISYKFNEILGSSFYRSDFPAVRWLSYLLNG